MEEFLKSNLFHTILCGLFNFIEPHCFWTWQCHSFSVSLQFHSIASHEQQNSYSWILKIIKEILSYKELLDFSVQLSNFWKPKGRNSFKSQDGPILTGLQELGLSTFDFHPSHSQETEFWGRNCSCWIFNASTEHFLVNMSPNKVFLKL